MSKEEAKKFDSILKAKNKTDFINYIVQKTNEERQEFRKTYKEATGKDLLEVIEKELKGDFEDCVLKLFKDPAEYDSEELKKAMKGAGTDEEILIEILTSRTADEMKRINEKYQEIYKVTLEQDVVDDTSGDFQNLLKDLIGCMRSRNKKPRQFQCQTIAKEIYDSVQAKKVDTAAVIRYFSSLSSIELQRVCQEYYKLSGKTIIEFIEKQFSGDFRDCVKALVYSIVSPAEYFATRVMKSIKGLGTNEYLLNRVIISRYNKDMPQIKMFFNKLYKKDMVEEIADDLSGDYLNLIKALVNYKS